MKNVREGFTLIEVVIALALSVVLLIALTSIFRSFGSLYTYQQAFRGTADASGAVVRAVESAAAPADQVLATHTFTQGPYASSLGTLVLELPSVDQSGAVVVGQHDYAAFYLNGSTAYRLVETGAGSARRAGTTKLGDNIVSLVFTYNNSNVMAASQVSVDVVASTTIRGQPATSHLTGTVRLRNFTP